MIPLTLEEWKQYIARLSGKTLLEKARAANSVMFVRTLSDEGMEAEEITEVLRAFAERLVAIGIAVPTRFDGAYLNYADLLPETDP